MLDVSHLITFLAGTAAGAAGTYMADRFTDQRRKQSAFREARKSYETIRAKMPELIQEMKLDLSNPEFQTFREFVILPTERTTFNHDKGRFEYYESAHPNAKTQVALLESVGYVQDISKTNWPIYRMSEAFVNLLTESQ